MEVDDKRMEVEQEAEQQQQPSVQCQNWLQSGFLLKAVISPRQPLSAVLGPRPGRGNARPWLSPQPPPTKLCVWQLKT